MKMRRQALVGDHHVEMLQVDDVAYRLRVAIELLELLGCVHGASLIPAFYPHSFLAKSG
jgi:hypothetical protein